MSKPGKRKLTFYHTVFVQTHLSYFSIEINDIFSKHRCDPYLGKSVSDFLFRSQFVFYEM